MITALLLLPAVLSTIVLAAHFLRAGQLLIVLLVLATIPLLAVRKPWSARIIQVMLALGALEWLRTMVRLGQIRAEMGVPYLRMAVILATVALVAACAAALFETRRVRQYFNRP